MHASLCTGVGGGWSRLVLGLGQFKVLFNPVLTGHSSPKVGVCLLGWCDGGGAGNGTVLGHPQPFTVWAFQLASGAWWWIGMALQGLLQPCSALACLGGWWGGLGGLVAAVGALQGICGLCIPWVQGAC